MRLVELATSASYMSTQSGISQQQGLTLVELLITVSIAAILLAVGVPSYRDFITSNTASSYANDLVADLNYAKSEAITRGVRTVVCKSATADDCVTGNWEGGWKVFVDCNGDNSRDSAAAVCPDWDGNGNADVEPLLRSHAALQTGWTVRGSGTINNRVSFDPTGLSRVAGTVRFCRDGGKSGDVDSNLGRAVIVNSAGRIRMAMDTDGNGTLDDNENVELECIPP